MATHIEPLSHRSRRKGARQKNPVETSTEVTGDFLEIFHQHYGWSPIAFGYGQTEKHEWRKVLQRRRFWEWSSTYSSTAIFAETICQLRGTLFTGDGRPLRDQASHRESARRENTPVDRQLYLRRTGFEQCSESPLPCFLSSNLFCLEFTVEEDGKWNIQMYVW